MSRGINSDLPSSVGKVFSGLVFLSCIFRNSHSYWDRLAGRVSSIPSLSIDRIFFYCLHLCFIFLKPDSLGVCHFVFSKKQLLISKASLLVSFITAPLYIHVCYMLGKKCKDMEESSAEGVSSSTCLVISLLPLCLAA